MKPWEALQTATILPARTFGYGKDLGSVEPENWPDLVMVSGDPLRDIRDAARVNESCWRPFFYDSAASAALSPVMTTDRGVRTQPS